MPRARSRIRSHLPRESGSASPRLSIPYVFDQLAMARLARETYALFVALLPATAAVIGVVVLSQLPSRLDVAGIALVMLGVALQRPESAAT